MPVWTRRSRQRYYYVLTKHTQKGHLPALAANPRRIRIPVAFPSHCCSSPPPPTQTLAELCWCIFPCLPSCRAAAHSSKRRAAAALQATQLRSISITFQISEFGHRIVFPVTELRGIYLPITHAAAPPLPRVRSPSWAPVTTAPVALKTQLRIRSSLRRKSVERNLLHVAMKLRTESFGVGIYWAVKTCFTCEIAVLDGNFEHKILIFRENPFHVTILTFSDL